MSEQSGDDGAKREWVARVLGIELPLAGAAVSNGSLPQELALPSREELEARVKDVLTQAALLSDPYRADLIGRARTVAGLLHGDDMQFCLEEVDALEDAYARAAGSARAEEAIQSVKGKVAYRKLQLEWRNAQDRANAGLDRFIAAVLADPEVQQDDVFDQVEDAAATASALIPRFGGELSDVLDRLDSTYDASERDALTREANQILDDYAKALAESEALQALQEFSNQEYGGIAFYGELESALGELRKAIV